MMSKEQDRSFQYVNGVDITKLSDREFEIFKLTLEQDSNRHWEDWRWKTEQQKMVRSEYDADTERIESHGNKIYSILLTSLILASGGGITAIISVYKDSIIGLNGIPIQIFCLYCLLVLSLAFSIIGGVCGRIANDNVLESISLTDEFPQKHISDAVRSKNSDFWNSAAYAFSLTAVISFVFSLLGSLILTFPV